MALVCCPLSSLNKSVIPTGAKRSGGTLCFRSLASLSYPADIFKEFMRHHTSCKLLLCNRFRGCEWTSSFSPQLFMWPNVGPPIVITNKESALIGVMGGVHA